MLYLSGTRTRALSQYQCEGRGYIGLEPGLEHWASTSVKDEVILVWDQDWSNEPVPGGKERGYIGLGPGLEHRASRWWEGKRLYWPHPVIIHPVVRTLTENM